VSDNEDYIHILSLNMPRVQGRIASGGM